MSPGGFGKLLLSALGLRGRSGHSGGGRRATNKNVGGRVGLGGEDGDQRNGDHDKQHPHSPVKFDFILKNKIFFLCCKIILQNHFLNFYLLY
jgi:hypothetical protein